MKDFSITVFFIFLTGLCKAQLFFAYNCDTFKLKYRTYYKPESEKDKIISIWVTCQMTSRMLKRMSKESTDMSNYVINKLKKSEKPNIKHYIASISDAAKAIESIKVQNETKVLDQNTYCFYQYEKTRYKQIQDFINHNNPKKALKDITEFIHNTQSQSDFLFSKIQYQLNTLNQKYRLSEINI